ncbi:CDC45 family [Pavlovales sp. CCMP2436]|nr:CDC45 family [Pavlovales sp. CCMP2436]
MLIPKSALLDVYNHIKDEAGKAEGCSVVLLVAPDADALAACKMLTSLMQLDYVMYSIKPVGSYEDIDERFTSIRSNMGESVRSLIMLNCGGIINLAADEYKIEISSYDVENEGGTELCPIYVFDSNRPLNLENVHEEAHHVRVIDDSLNVQTVQDLVELGYVLGESGRGESDESDSDLDDSDAAETERVEQRRRLNDGRYEGLSADQRRGFRREVRQHLKAYYKGSWQSTSVASLCLELAIAQNRVSNELLWLSSLGLTDQFVHERIGDERYLADVTKLHQLVLTRNADDAGEVGTTRVVDDESQEIIEVNIASCGRRGIRLVFEDEYRHCPQYVWQLLGVFTKQAEARLRQLFASMGVPLVQVQQKWTYMDERIKRELRAKLEEYAPRAGLPDFSYGSFVLVSGYRTQLAAADVVYAVSALLESAGIGSRKRGQAESDGAVGGAENARDEIDATTGSRNYNGVGPGVSAAAGLNAALADASAASAAGGQQVAQVEDMGADWQKAFWRAYDALGSSSTDEPELAAGVALATQLQRAVVETGKIVIENKRMTSLGTFMKVTLAECPALRFFLESPMALSRLALFIADALRGIGRRSKPVVVAAPDVLAKTHLIVAVTGSARFGDVQKNAFHSRFRRAADQMGAHVKQVRLNTTCIEIASSDLSVFFTNLVSVS